MRKVLLAILLVVCGWQLSAQTFLKENEFHYRPYNNLDIYLIQNTGDPVITLNLTVRSGPFAEVDSIWGTSVLYQQAFMQRISPWLKSINAKVIATPGRESANYVIQFAPYRLDEVLSRLTTELSAPVAVTDVTSLSLPADTSNMHLEKLRRRLWNEYYARVTLIPDSLPTASGVSKVYSNLYCADNAVIVLRGNINNRELYQKIETTVSGWKKCRYDYFAKNSVPLATDMLFNSQVVMEQEGVQPTFYIKFRGAASRDDRKHALGGILLQEVINTAKSVQVFADSNHIRSIKFTAELARYASESTFEVTVDPTRADSGYLASFLVLQHLRDGKLFTAAELETAKKNLINRYEQNLKDPVAQTSLLASAWVNNTIDDYSQLKEQLQVLTIEDLCAYAQRYLYGKTYVAGLLISPADRAAMQTDTFFTDTYPIEQHQFFFLKNTGTAADSTQDSLVQNLVQLLKINPRMKVMISGTAAKDELLQISDAEMVKFMEAHPGFTLTPADLIPTKKIRLDVYRAMKIVKRLIEAGIPENQLVGTGSTVQPGEKAPQSDYQVYCTLFYY